jgi:hypothetical protein
LLKDGDIPGARSVLRRLEHGAPARAARLRQQIQIVAPATPR